MKGSDDSMSLHRRVIGTVSILLALSVVACTPAAPSPASPTAPPAAAKPTTPPAAAAQPTTAPAAAAQPTTAPAVAQPKAPAPTAPAAAAVPNTPITLSVLWAAGGPQEAFLREVVLPRFNRKYPNVTVQFDTAPTNQIDQKVLTSAAGGGAPDVFWAFDYSAAAYVQKGLVAPVDPAAQGFASQDALIASYLPNTLAGYMFDGKLYSTPFHEASFSLYLNIRHFKEAGLDPDKDAPKTWDDVIRVAKTLTKTDASGKIVQHGFRFSVNDPNYLYRQLAPLVQQYGGDILDANGKCIANNEAGVKALAFRNSFVTEHKTEDPTSTLNTPSAPLDDFVKEKASMFLTASAGTDPWIMNGNPDLYNNHLFKAVPLPQVDPAKPATMAYAQSALISGRAPADRQAAAQAFVADLMSTPVESFKAFGALSPTAAFRDSPEAKSYPSMDSFMTDLSRGKFAPRSAHYPEIRDAFGRAVDRVVLNRQDPKASLDQFCDDVNRAVSAG
jgi:multiple sugar transport system substrate-binding protein